MTVTFTLDLSQHECSCSDMLVFMLFSSCGPNPTPVLWGFLPSLVWPIWSLRAFKDGSDEKQHIRKYSVLCKSKQRFNVREPVQRCEQQPLIFIFLLQHNPKTAAALCNAGALHNPIKPSYGDNAFAFSSERKIKLRLRSV